MPLATSTNTIGSDSFIHSPASSLVDGQGIQVFIPFPLVLGFHSMDVKFNVVLNVLIENLLKKHVPKTW
jgi:hypothetical protein